MSRQLPAVRKKQLPVQPSMFTTEVVIEAVVEACAKAWPELNWYHYRKMVRGERAHCIVCSVQIAETAFDISLSLPPPKNMGPRWTIHASASFQVQDITEQLRPAIEQARSLWRKF